MNTHLSQEHINEYRNNGFVVIDDFLTSYELALWRDAVDEAVGARGTTKLAGREQDARWQSSDNYYDKVFVQRINLWQDSETMQRLMLDPRLGKAIAFERIRIID